MPVAASDSRADCLSKLAVKFQLHLGCCVLFQKFLTIASAAVGYVALLFALGWDGSTDDEVLATIVPALHNHCSRSVFDVYGYKGGLGEPTRSQRWE
eukprot:3035144-Prymnesium_polylepis.1